MGKTLRLSSTKIVSPHPIRVIIKAKSPQLLRLQDLDQLQRLSLQIATGYMKQESPDFRLRDEEFGWHLTKKHLFSLRHYRKFAFSHSSLNLKRSVLLDFSFLAPNLSCNLGRFQSRLTSEYVANSCKALTGKRSIQNNLK